MSSVAGPEIHDFSRALADLFHAAETTSLDHFPAALLSVLRRHLVFDGAVVGHADPLCYGDFRISVAHVHGRDASLLEEYAQVSAGDPVTSAFLQGLAQPIAVDTERFYERPEYSDMLAYVRKHHLRHLLLCGRAPTQNDRGSWVVLYRSKDEIFDQPTRNWFGAFCNHLDRAFDQNRDQALANFAPRRRRRGLALVDKEGRVDLADSRFSALLKTEFRNALPHRLPMNLLNSMKQAKPFDGRSIRMHFSPAGSHVLCEVRAAGPLGLLTRRESQIALLFAQGRTSTAIAEDLGISKGTVHTHLAHVYQKLSVTDKVRLSLVLAEHADTEAMRRDSSPP